MSTPHMLLPITHRPEGWVWRCTCGDRGPLAPGRVVFDCPNGWYVSAIPQSQHTWEAFAFDNKGVLRLEVTGGVDHYDLTGEEVEQMVDLAAEQEMVL